MGVPLSVLRFDLGLLPSVLRFDLGAPLSVLRFDLCDLGFERFSCLQEEVNYLEGSGSNLSGFRSLLSDHRSALSPHSILNWQFVGSSLLSLPRSFLLLEQAQRSLPMATECLKSFAGLIALSGLIGVIVFDGSSFVSTASLTLSCSP